MKYLIETCCINTKELRREVGGWKYFLFVINGSEVMLIDLVLKDI